MALQDTDKFVVQRGTGYLTVQYDTLADSIVPDLAIQSTDVVRGTPGIMFPGNTLRYENGELNVDFPTSLRFIDIITEDNQEPRDLSYSTGDFYLVSIPEDETVQIDSADWPGIDGKEYTSVQLTGTNGTGYKADSGAYHSLNGPNDTGTIYENLTSSKAFGVILDVAIEFGRIRIDTIEIKSGGTNYEVGDIFSISTAYSGGAPAVFEVDEVSDDGDGVIEKISPVDADAPTGIEYIGFGFLLPEEYPGGTLSRARTFTHTGNGTGLLVDAQVQNGSLTGVSISPFSSHNNYKSGDVVYVADSFGSRGDARIEVKVDTDSSDYIIGYNGDKIIYRSADVTDNVTASWLLVESGKSDISLLQVTNLSKGVKPTAAGEEYFNPEAAIIIENDKSTRTARFTIKNAKAEVYPTGYLDNDKSYSGLFHPAEKIKLQDIEEEATRGSLDSIVTDVRTDIYTGRNYYSLDVKTFSDPVANYRGHEVSINVISASYGLQGVMSVIPNQVVTDTILDRASANNSNVINESINATMNAGQISEYFAPKNFYTLRKLY